MKSIHVTRTLTQAATERLASSGHRVRVLDADEPPSRAELLAFVPGSSAIVCTLTERIDREVMEAAGGDLRVIANVAVGVDNIDVEAARRRSVLVTNTPDVLTEATADLAFGLIIVTCRRIAEGDRFLRRGRTWAWSPTFFLGPPVHGSILGIVGFGRIGRAVARRAQGFGMQVLATGSGLSEPDDALDDGVSGVRLEELLEASDVVSLHCPLTERTRGLIGREQLRRMKSTAVLVNTSRGPVVDEAALVDAVRRGDIAGAGLDVFADEPHLHEGLRTLDQVVLTPHIGSADVPTREAMCALAVDNALAVLAGREPLTPVL